MIGSYGTCLPGSKISVRVADQEDYLRRMFDDYDTNGDGDIDQHELKEQLEQIFIHGGVEELPLSDEEIENVLDSLDKDGNGTVDVDEWVSWLMEGIADPRSKKIRNTRCVCNEPPIWNGRGWIPSPVITWNDNVLMLINHGTSNETFHTSDIG